MTSPRPEGTFFKGASKVGLQGARWPWVRGVIPERCDPGRMRASASILSGFVRCCVDALVSGEAATGPPRAGRAGAAQASLRRLLGGGRAPVTRPPAGVPSGAGGGRARRRRRAAAGAPRAARLGRPARGGGAIISCVGLAAVTFCFRGQRRGAWGGGGEAEGKVKTLATRMCGLRVPGRWPLAPGSRALASPQSTEQRRSRQRG